MAGFNIASFGAANSIRLSQGKGLEGRLWGGTLNGVIAAGNQRQIVIESGWRGCVTWCHKVLDQLVTSFDGRAASHKSEIVPLTHSRNGPWVSTRIGMFG